LKISTARTYNGGEAEKTPAIENVDTSEIHVIGVELKSG